MKKKVGIYTFSHVYNYGALLQAYALQYFIRRNGFEVEFVDVYTRAQERINEYSKVPSNLKECILFLCAKMNPFHRRKLRRFRSFRRRLNLSRRYESRASLRSSPPDYDFHIVGSDQVWNLENGLSNENYFFLDFLNRGSRKISYAASFGSNFIPNNIASEVGIRLKDFSAISCRESDGCEIVRRISGLEAAHVLDPSFLVPIDHWSDFAEDAKVKEKEDYIFAYVDGSPEAAALISFVKRKLELPVYAVSVGLIHSIPVDRFIQDAGPKEFLSLMANSKFVVSTSYHGVVFALIFQRDFLTTVREPRNVRVDSLLRKLSLLDRKVSDVSTLGDLGILSLPIDYERVLILLCDNKDLTSLPG